MPTPEAPEANASTSTSTSMSPSPSPPPSPSVALRKANTTGLAVEEADSFKANVSTSTMTQDQCLDNGHHQANSNVRSSSDKVSDDLNNSKNSVVSNGVKSVQEFNVDVNREYSTDLVIVQDRTVDADSSPTGEVLPTSKRSTETPTPSDCVNSNKDILDNSIGNIDANKSKSANNNTAPDMTVITHQNSSENMRDIISNSEKANKISSDVALDTSRVEKNERSDLNSRNAMRSTGTRRVRKLIRSENVNECEIDQIEDPIERLNKLRASISSALSEVKGVLKQYSTEQSCDEPNESAPSKQPSDDGPVRFRFVRKIRRRSVFSEDDETAIPLATTDVTATPIIENKVIESVPSESRDSEKTLTDKDQDKTVVVPKLEEDQKPSETSTDGSENKFIQKAAPESTADIEIPKDKSSTSVNENPKTTKEDSSGKNNEDSSATTSEAPKTKNGKIKKVLKKDRRASIAAVEINQISGDQPPVPLDLKTQRRPSDSGTLVKQATRVKAKTGEKTKLLSSRKAKTSPSSKTESSTTKPSQTGKAVEKASSTLSTEEKPSSSSITDSTTTLDTHAPDASVIESSIKPTTPTVSGASTQNTPPPSNVESIIVEKASVPAKSDASPTPPTIAEVNELTKLTSSKVTPVPTVSSSANVDIPTISPKLTDVNAPAESIVNKLSEPELAASIAPIAPINSTEAPKTSSKISEAASAQAVSAKVIDDSPQSISEAVVTPLKPNIVQAPIHLQQSLKPNTETTKVAIPNQQITKPKQLPQDSKTKTPSTLPSVKVESPKSISNTMEVLENKTVSPHLIQANKQTKMSTEVSKAATVKESKTIPTAVKVEANKKSNATEAKQMQNNSTSGTPKQAAESTPQKDIKTPDSPDTNADDSSSAEPEVPIPSNVPKDAVAVKLNLPGQESVEELQRLEEQQDKETTPPETTETTETSETAAAAPPKKKRKAKRKVVIRRIKRKLSKDDTFLHQKEIPAELEICEKEIEEKDLDEEPEEEVSNGPKQPKSCLKNRQFEIGDVVMYAEHYKKTQVRWKKAVVTERITSISYKLNIEGEERPAHISYIKKFTDRKVNFGGKEYLEIDYAQIEENEEKERNYSIWNLV